MNIDPSGTTYIDVPRNLPPNRHKEERQYVLFWVLIVVAFIAGLAVGLPTGAGVGESRPPATRGFVNVEGHQGEILVVGPNYQIQWTTEAELRREAGDA